MGNQAEREIRSVVSTILREVSGALFPILKITARAVRFAFPGCVQARAASLNITLLWNYLFTYLVQTLLAIHQILKRLFFLRFQYVI